MKRFLNQCVKPIGSALFLITLVLHTAITGLISPLGAQDRGGIIAVELSIDGLRVDQTTNSDFPTKGPEDRDEPYVEVLGQDLRTFAINHRHPDVHGTSEDYFESGKGDVMLRDAHDTWTNLQGHIVQHPILWRGELADGERAGFLVLLREQDNEHAGAAAAFLKLIFGTCEAIAGTITESEKGGVTAAKAVQEGCKHANKLSESLPKDDIHELIGAFYVTVENVEGQLQTTYLAANGEMVNGETATTKILGYSDDTFGITVLEGEVVNDQVFMAMTDNEGAGRYAATVSSKTIERTDVYGYAKLNGKDVERGTCRNGKDVRLRRADGTLVAMPVGAVRVFLGAEIGGVNYFCGGSFEREGYIFDRSYDHFVVQRTQDKLNFYPFFIEPFASSVGFTNNLTMQALAPVALAPAAIPNFDLPNGQRIIQHRLTRPAQKSTYCERVLSHSYTGWPVKPVTSWWSKTRKDMFTTDQASWYGCEGDANHVGLYGFHRLEGLVFAADKPKPEGTVPLYRFWKHDALDNLTSTSLEFPQLPKNATDGYGTGRLVGYIHPANTMARADLKMLNTWYNSTTGDFLTTTKKAWNGTPGDRRGAYILVRSEGYVLRAPK